MHTRSTPIDLTSVYAKIQRAEEHIRSVDAELTEWLESGSHTYTLERNEERTQTYFRAKMYGPKPDYLRWTLIVGDAINNLRSALDHLVYAYAKHQRRDTPGSKVEGSAFVIADTHEKWNHPSNRKKLSCLSIPIMEAIKAVQPFSRKHPDLPPLLSILRDFSNADKHRLLRVAAAAISHADVSFTSPNIVPKAIGVKMEPIEDGDIFAVVEANQAEPGLRILNAQFHLEVCLWHELREGESDSRFKRSPVILLMNLLAEEVKEVVRIVITAGS